MLSYNEQLVLKEKISSFMNVFFNALEQDQAAFVLAAPAGLYPMIEDEQFNFDANTYLIFDEDKAENVESITFEHDTVMIRRTNDILCIQRLKDGDHYYGFRMEPTKKVDSDWLKALHMLTTYSTRVLKGRVRNILITYQNAGYRITPVSPIKLEELSPQANKRARAILA